MPGTSQQPDDRLSPTSVRSALKALDSLQELGGHPLARLHIVKARLQAEALADTPAGRGMALRAVLLDGIESLRPDNGEPDLSKKRWRPYLILKEKYLDGRSRDYLTAQMHIARSTFFEEQKRALNRLTDRLRRWEHRGSLGEPTAPSLAPPLPPYDLVGRDDLLRDLKQRLFAGGSLALNGLPGVGKTALAIALAHDREVLEHFSDGVLWAGLGRKGEVFSHLSAWGTALGIPSAEISKLTTIEDRVKAIHTAIGMRRMLLVVDDAWEVKAALDFRLGGPNCAHLVTTRLSEVALRFAGEGTRVVHELSEDNGFTLLAYITPEVVEAEPDEAQELVRAVGGLPLALILIGNHLRVEAHDGQPRRLRKALDKLQQAEERLKLAELQAPLERHPSLPAGVPLSLLASIGVSDEALDEEARCTLWALSVFSPKPNSFSEEAALAVSNVSVETLYKLLDHGLLESSGPGRYTLHQTIADYAGDRLGNDRTPIRRQADFYLAFVQEYSNNWQTIETEVAQIRHAWRALDGLADEQRVLDYVYVMEDFQFQRGLWRERIAWCERGLVAARRIKHRQDEGWMLNQLGWCYRDLGEACRSLDYYEPSLSIRRDIGDRSGEAQTLNEIGVVYDDLGEPDQALRFLESALSIWRDVGDRTNEAQTLSNIGSVYADMGQLDQTLTYYDQAMRIYRDDLHDLPGEAWMRNNIGFAYLARGEPRKALEALEPTLRIQRDRGDLREQLHVLNNIGAAYRELGDPRKALEYYEQSLSICQNIKARRDEAIALHNIGVAHLDLNDPRQAIVFFEKALPIRRDVGDRDGEASTLASIGSAYRVLGKPDKGCGFVEQAIAIWRDIHNQRGEALGLNRLGKIYAALGELNRAEDCFQQALTIHQSIPHPPNEADTLYEIAMIREAQGKFDEAERLLEKAIVIDEIINSPKLQRDRAALERLKGKSGQ